MNRSIRSFLLTGCMLLVLAACLPPPPTSGSTPPPIPATPPPAPADRSIFKAGLAPGYQDMTDQLPYASMYEINFNIADDLYHIAGHESVVYTNAEAAALSEVKLRLFPNILGGEMRVDEVLVNDETSSPGYGLKNSLMTIPFKQPLQPGENVTLKIGFNISIPQSVELNYGVQAYYQNVLALAHAYPMIAVYDDEGWNAEVPPQSGDVTYADMSFFIVTVDAPQDIVIATSGREISRQETGTRQTVRYAAGPVRDFYLAASRDYQVVTRDVNGVKLNFYTSAESKEGARSALDTASRALEVYGTRYAPYPYTELDFVSTPTLALGIEYPGMIALADWIVDPNNGYLEATVAHETAHQWFYNLVGNDQLDDPWLDESLSQFATLQYFTDEYGQSGADGFRADLESRWARVNNETIPVGLPVRLYDNTQYGAIVYGRGALFFESLRREMGPDGFDGFMKDYVKNFSWGIATPAGLKSQAEQDCACNLSALFDHWIFP